MKRLRSTRLTSGFAVLFLVGVFACSPREESRAPGGPKTLVWGISVQPDNLNPLVAASAMSRDLLSLLFFKLNDFGPPPALDYEPVLATGWQEGEDGLSLTYFLRQDVLWDDGSPLTARDVKFTFDMMANPQVPYPNKSQISEVADCEIVDEWTVRFRFRVPPAEPLFATQFWIVPEHRLRDVPPEEMISCAFNRSPVGHGHWKFGSWVSDDRLVFEANDRCAFGRPLFDRVVFRVIPEESTLRAELFTGGIDAYFRYPNKYCREDAKRADLVFQRISDRNYTYIGWNYRRSLFRDVRVRRALTLATDRQTIIDAFRGGFGSVVDVPLYPEHRAFNPNLEPMPFDPERAARLLDEAGWSERDEDGVRIKDGQRFEFTFLLVAGNTIGEEIATMVQEEYHRLGIAVSMEFFEWTVFLEKLRAKNFDATILARRVGFVYDPGDLFHSRSIEGQYNDVSFANAEIDSLIDLAKSIPDRSRRAKVWWKFQEVFQREVGVTVLYVGASANPVRRDRVANPVMDIRGAFLRLHEWRPVESAGA
jgi:peptide/nickel transport system substrate-binding protein